jgi:predicted RecB family nuclease
MIFGPDGTFVLSPSDLTASASCEFGWLRRVDEKRGLIDLVETVEDAMLARTSVLGDAHEQRVLAAMTSSGATIATIEVASPYSAATLGDAAALTRQAFDAQADVVYQATFFDGTFGGKSDFVVRQADGAYQVQDAKLARRAKRDALIQIAAYSDLLDQIGVPRSKQGSLILGDNTIVSEPMDPIIAVYRHRRARLEALLREHLSEGAAVQWSDPRYSFCGGCEHCAAEIDLHDDLMQVAGMRQTQRALLISAGISTMGALGASTQTVPSIPAKTLAKLRSQASLQSQTSVGGTETTIPFDVFNPSVLLAIPEPDDGDIFFDFEGDPLWADESGADFGLEYLFGLVVPDGSPRGAFTSFWAHDRGAEKQALIDCFALVKDRWVAHPGMHIYHYASYEVTALKRLVVRHGIGEDFLDDLLRAGVFVDLYSVVRQSLRVGQPSYSIKKLEPLYMGDDLRSDDGVTTAVDSIVKYAEYVAAINAGEATLAAELLGQIADYNHYDCTSTWKLRDWLLGHQPEQIDISLDPFDAPGATSSTDREIALQRRASLVERLLASVPDEGRTDDQQAVALVAAAVDFHRREHRPYWWVWFDRLISPPDEWLESRSGMLIEGVEVIRDWGKVGKARTLTRDLRCVGELEAGSDIREGATVKTLYDDVPPTFELTLGAVRAVSEVGRKVLAVETDPETGADVVILQEGIKGSTTHDELPMGIVVSDFVSTNVLEDAIESVATTVAGALPDLPRQPAIDILARRRPRLQGGTFDGTLADDCSESSQVTKTIRELDRSYVAVQGPPGTGKTYTGSRVVAELVNEGWRVGVVAQGHSTVEHFLRAAIAAGVDPSRIVKRNGQSDGGTKPWATPGDNVELVDAIDAIQGGALVGGTAWTFAGTVDGLDLLVIDEAGQFSLANTIAVSVATERLLLLGDPQQLPQVSQGIHPEPVDWSALGWLMDGHDTMPPDLGYFLAHSRRMHSAVTEPVSQLSYDGRLTSAAEVTDSRHMSGIEPGLHAITVHHHGRSVTSPEEAETVVGVVKDALQQTWLDAAGQTPRKVRPTDVLVVAPYNAQVWTIRRALDEAGFTDTRVGTVDKFQGQEAPLVILSMTASSSADVPRGLDFLLNRNRLNVGISRAQWASYIVYSPVLCDYLPNSTDELIQLGAFTRLVEDER